MPELWLFVFTEIMHIVFLIIFPGLFYLLASYYISLLFLLHWGVFQVIYEMLVLCFSICHDYVCNVVTFSLRCWVSVETWPRIAFFNKFSSVLWLCMISLIFSIHREFCLCSKSKSPVPPNYLGLANFCWAIHCILFFQVFCIS